MAKDDIICVEGRISELLPNAYFRVQIVEGGPEIVGHLSGKMRKNNIRVLLGDRVNVEMSPYDLGKGRIIYRFK